MRLRYHASSTVDCGGGGSRYQCCLYYSRNLSGASVQPVASLDPRLPPCALALAKISRESFTSVSARGGEPGIEASHWHGSDQLHGSGLAHLVEGDVQCWVGSVVFRHVVGQLCPQGSHCLGGEVTGPLR